MNVRLIKSVDRVLGTLLVRILPPRVPTPDFTPNSFLFIRPGGIGDAVLLIPAINLLKQNYPESNITVLAEMRNGGIFRLASEVDRVLLYDRPRELIQAIRNRYAVVIDTEQWHRLSAVVAWLVKGKVSIGYATNQRKNLFTYSVQYSHEDYEVKSFCKLLAPLGISITEDVGKSFLTVPEDAICKATTLLGDLAEKSFIVIFPGASIPERRWGADRFAEVAKRLRLHGYSVVVVGGREDIADGEIIIAGGCGLDLAGKTSLIETAAIIDRAKVMVSGDSGILHMGVGLGKPTVSLFGPGIVKKWAPGGNKHIVINKNLPCSPCTRFGYTPKCPIGARCLNEIVVDEVVNAVESLLSRQDGE